MEKTKLAEMKSWIAIILGIVIIVSDLAWLYVGSSYTYTPWLVLGIIIFIAALVWIGIDASYMRGSKPPKESTASSPSKQQ